MPIQVLSFVKEQDQTNRWIKAFSHENYDAALQWITQHKADAQRRSLVTKKALLKQQPQIMDFKSVDPIEELQIFKPATPKYLQNKKV